MDPTSKLFFRGLFSDSEWNLIYNIVGNVLDNKDYNSEDVYNIRFKIDAILSPDEEVAQ